MDGVSVDKRGDWHQGGCIQLAAWHLAMWAWSGTSPLDPQFSCGDYDI